MNVNNENTEPVTDLELPLDYSNQCIQRRLNDDSGAGANAGSRVDVTFAAKDSLSELVWSPHEGLSLKCADCIFTDKKQSLLMGAGLSITSGMSMPNKPIDEESFGTSLVPFQVMNEAAQRDFAQSSRSDAGIMPVCGSSHKQSEGTCGFPDGMNTAAGVSLLHINQKENKREGFCGQMTQINSQVADMHQTGETNLLSVPGLPGERMADILSKKNDKPDILSRKNDKPEADMMQIEPLSADSNGGGSNDGNGSQTLGMEIILASEPHLMYENGAPDIPLPNLASPCRRQDKLASVIGEESRKKWKKTSSTSVPAVEKMESTAENGLRTLTSENACGVGSKIVASDPANEVKNRSWQDIHPIDKTIPVKNSPTNSGIHINLRKGKEKALSDGNVSGGMSKEVDDSHESVESCNSAGLFSTGIKRWGSEHNLIIGSKRFKKQIQESPGTLSFIRQDSSFVSWISNMMKGFLKSDQDGVPSLGLTLAHPNHGHESPDQKVITCNKNLDPGCRSTGFQSILKSLYCSNTEIQETRALSASDRREEAKEVELSKKSCDINDTQIPCRGENDNFCKKFLLSNGKFDESISGNGSGPSTQPQILPVNITASKENRNTNSVENKNSCNLAFGKEKDGISSNSALGKRKTRSAENNESDLPSEGKTAHNVGCRISALGSPWITRFAPKTSGPLLKLDHCNLNSSGALDCSTDCMRLIARCQNRVGASNDHKTLEDRENSTEEPLNVIGKELQNCPANIEDSTCFNRIKGHNDQKFVYKLSPISTSQRFKNLEAMTCIFARRLDALKRIIPSDVTDNAARETTTCLFCGIRGHHLRDCSEIAETELDDLLRNISSHERAEESPCLCIRCFKLDHWAIECPNTSRKCIQSDSVGSLISHWNLRKQQLSAGNKISPKLLHSKEGQFLATSAHTVCAGNNARIDADPNLEQKLKENATSEIMIFNLNSIKKYCASGSGKIKLNKNEVSPFCNFVSREISDVPNGVFDVVQRLRLSRRDILKCMDSHISLSHLNGFFLRLRLGKWAEGLGGTGYYVARVSEAQREISPQNATNPIPVNVGGIKCLVENQHISNHEFRQDELMAWWLAVSTNGGKIPSEEDLKVKFEKKKMLGLEAV